jgi:hypothetical protein
MKKRLLKVYYGYTKLNKVMTKSELAIYFENDNNNPEKNLRYVSRCMDIVHTRLQSQDEEDDKPSPAFKMFHKFGYLIDSKLWKGNIDNVLKDNFIADENNVSVEERELIKSKLKEYYNTKYKKI